MKKLITAICIILILVILGGVAVSNRELMDKLNNLTDTETEAIGSGNSSGSEPQEFSYVGEWLIREFHTYEYLTSFEDEAAFAESDSNILFYLDEGPGYTSLSYVGNDGFFGLYGLCESGWNQISEVSVSEELPEESYGSELKMYIYSDDIGEDVKKWLSVNGEKVSDRLLYDVFPTQFYSFYIDGVEYSGVEYGMTFSDYFSGDGNSDYEFFEEMSMLFLADRSRYLEVSEFPSFGEKYYTEECDKFIISGNEYYYIPGMNWDYFLGSIFDDNCFGLTEETGEITYNGKIIYNPNDINNNIIDPGSEILSIEYFLRED